MTDIRLYLERLLLDVGEIELRHLPSKRRGFYNNLDDLRTGVRELSGSGNLYVTHNRRKARFGINRIVEKDELGIFPATKDSDIEFVTRFFVDLDPVKPDDCSATDEEKAATRAHAKDVWQFLKAMGFPQPVFADSGNGTHIMCRIHLPNTVEIKEQARAIHSGMAQEFSTPTVKFDGTVYNAGRIAPLYGTWKRKGLPTTERPHRRSGIIELPRHWQQVPRGAFDRLANYYARQTPIIPPRESSRTFVSGAGDYATLDVVAWFQAHNHYKGFHKPHGGAQMHRVVCPWHELHSDTRNLHDPADDSAVIYENIDAWPGFECKHDHCQGRGIADVMSYFGDADEFCTRQFVGEKRDV